jgi:hypothetical protein
MAKRKAVDALIIELDEAVGSVNGLRVSNTRDALKKRPKYTIKLYSVSPACDPPVPACFSDRTQLHLVILDSRFRKSKLAAREFAQQYIIALSKNSYVINIYVYVVIVVGM